MQETFATYAERTAFERPLMSGVAYAERVLHANRALFESTHGWAIKEMFSKERQQDFDEYAPTTMSQKTVFYLTSLDMMSGQVCASISFSGSTFQLMCSSKFLATRILLHQDSLDA